MLTLNLADEKATIEFGKKLAKHCTTGTNIYLYGDLGAGKTTLVRGMIQAFLPNVKVKSPTYTLVEDYELTNSTENPNNLNHIYHFDLYRLGDPEELEYLGGRDYFADDAVCLIEWPMRGEGWLSEADLEIHLKYQEEARDITLKALTDKAVELIKNLSSK
ncbi:MAG: tRNA (adenosine(37)-N6)-threonylcarbamoyltransferase complex ATPase subunit type 1 TsaE [Woeseiaceae bacterium]